METVVSAAKLVGGVTLSTMLGVVVDQNTNVPLGVMFGVMGTVVVAAWWLSSKFTSIDDQLKELSKGLEEVKTKTTSPPCVGSSGDKCNE